MECSNRGECDRATGRCKCMTGFSGTACERSNCPRGCSGHGHCRSLSDYAQRYRGTESIQFLYDDVRNAYTPYDCSRKPVQFIMYLLILHTSYIRTFTWSYCSICDDRCPYASILNDRCGITKSSTPAFATPATTGSIAPCVLVQRETIRSQLIRLTKFSWSCVRCDSSREIFHLLFDHGLPSLHDALTCSYMVSVDLKMR